MNLVAVLLAPLVAYGTCNWTWFGDQNNCDDESCGIGCLIVTYGPINRYCSNGTDEDECCECWSQVTTCDCLFGTGYGIETSQHPYRNRTCELDDPLGGSPGPGECVSAI